MSKELIRSLPGGGLIKVEGLNWDLTLPNGRHLRGTAPTDAAAKEAAMGEYKDWAFERWMAGSPLAGQRFVCSLK